MTATVHIPGKNFREAERRFSKTGKPYVAATVREGDGDSARWWKIICFSESGGDELMRLGDGEGVSVSGSFKVEQYEKDGEQRLSFTVFADAVLSARPIKREKADKREDKPAERREPAKTSAQGVPFDDGVDGLFGGPPA